MKALNDYAAANGIALTDEEKAAIDSDIASLGSYATLQGYSSVNNFLAANYGTGVNSKVASKMGTASSLASKGAERDSAHLTLPTSLRSTTRATTARGITFDVAYYYIAAEKVAGEDGNESATDETVAAAKAKADAILAAYNELEGDDAVERLNAAIAEAGEEGECVHNSNTAGSALGACWGNGPWAAAKARR